jgi:hypothetical protein
MWLYSLLRFGMFFVLWGLLYLLGAGWLLGGAIAIVLSVPLSLVLLAKPRAKLAANLDDRINDRRERADDLDTRLNSDD